MDARQQRFERLAEGLVVVGAAETPALAEVFVRAAAVGALNVGHFLGVFGHGLSEFLQQTRQRVLRRDDDSLALRALLADVELLLLTVLDIGHVDRGRLFLADHAHHGKTLLSRMARPG